MLKEHEFHRRELVDFQGSDRFKQLRVRYWNKKTLSNTEIKPHWNRDTSTKELNWEISEEEYDNLHLFDVKLKTLMDNMYESSAYFFPRVYKVAYEDQFLRIIDKWLQKVPLPPPVITNCGDHEIGKRDGYHRIAMCCLLNVEVLPCWVMGNKAIDILKLEQPQRQTRLEKSPQ